MSANLEIVKHMIGIYTDAEDTYIEELLKVAKLDLEKMGIVLDAENASDNHLIRQYTVWQYRTRKTGEAMPRSLAFSIHNHLIGSVQNDS